MLKLLADVNVEKLIIENLSGHGFDVKAVVDIDKYLLDEKIVNLANTEARILITNDKDFGEIVYRQKLISKGIILLRLPEKTDKEKSDILLDLFNKGLVKENNFIVITKDKIRFSPLGI